MNKKTIVLILTILLGYCFSSHGNGNNNSQNNLLSAVYLNDEAAVRNLLKNKDIIKEQLNPSCSSNELCQPIAYSVKNGSTEITSLLLDAGANIDSNLGFSGDTPLIMAIANSHRKLVELLIKRGANINKPNKFGVTPFGGVCSIGDLDLIKLFLKAHVNINGSNNMPDFIEKKKVYVSNVTPLMIASKKGFFDIVELLLSYGADIKLKDSIGRSAIDYARENGHTKIATLLDIK